ncbi:MAG: DUF3786 domain-containing protein [Clostridiales Family XIII bacterium]|jgi:hypothetical protein|nr:DUF3786 domain-containing protein [Clostridiales Family XIII bacterium]
MTNYEKAYEQIRPWLGKLAEPREIQFLGRLWRVDQGGVDRLSGPPAHVNCKSVLVWYFTFGGQGEPSYEFVPLHGFSHGIFRENDWETGACATLTLDGFRAVSARLGADFLRRARYGEAWLLRALPKLPALLTYSEADEEFPATLDIKYGANATTFLPFESLAVLNGLIRAEYRERE